MGFIDLLFFSHVFPVAAGHVVELFAGIHALLDADGLEIGAPEVLQQLVVAAEHLFIQFAVFQTKRHSRLVFEGDADHGLAVIVEAIVPLGIVDEPGLVVEPVLKMIDDDRQHIVIG